MADWPLRAAREAASAFYLVRVEDCLQERNGTRVNMVAVDEAVKKAAEQLPPAAGVFAARVHEAPPSAAANFSLISAPC